MTMLLPRSIRHRLAAATGFCVFCLCSDVAQASPLFDLTGDTMGMGGLQPRTVPSGAAAAYFNPALLIDSPAGLQASFLVVHQRLATTLAGRPGTEFAVPDGIANAGRADASRFDNYPIPTNDLQFGREEEALVVGFEARPRQGAGTGRQTFTYEGIGLNMKLLDDRLALGFLGMIPNGEFTQLRAFFNDEREQYFSNSLHSELYGERLTAPSLAFGVGIQLMPSLSIGVGSTLSLAADVGAPTYVVDTGDLEKILIDLDGGVSISLSPHFGVAYGARGLRLTATAHAPRKLEMGTGFTFLLANGVEQRSGVPFVLGYSPWQLGAGAAYDVLDSARTTLTLAGTLVYASWSTYVDRHGDRPSKAYPWADTISPTVGLRLRSGDFHTLLDVSYTPTPVPPQTGRTNYVDNDRLSTSAGGEYRFEAFGLASSLGVQLQMHRLLARTQTKIPTPTQPNGDNIAPDLVKDEVPDDAQISGEPLEGAEGLQTNNPGWPGFGSKGWLLAAALYVQVNL